MVMQVAHTKLSTLLPQRAPFLPEHAAEVDLINTAAPKPALLQGTRLSSSDEEMCSSQGLSDAV